MDRKVTNSAKPANPKDNDSVGAKLKWLDKQARRFLKFAKITSRAVNAYKLIPQEWRDLLVRAAKAIFNWVF